MTRRDQLLLLIGVSALRFASGIGRAATQSGRPQRFVVVGAGLAGLAAARELQAHGHQVVVVEGRERTGGRVWTSHKWQGIPLDMGATWIHGTRGNPITALARKVPAKLVRTDYDRHALFGPDGARLGDDKRLERIRKDVFRVLRQAQDAPSDSPIRRVVEAAFPNAADTEAVLREFVLGSEIEHEYAGSVDELSTYWFDNDTSFGGPDMLFPGGFQVITDFLARGLNVQLGRAVEKIDWTGDQVRVLAGNQQWEADAALITLPLGVFQSGKVRFAPELPDFKRRAIRELGSGLLNKCCLRFPRAFWPVDADWLQHTSSVSGAWIEWVSFVRATGQPVLVGFHAADRAREVEKWSDQRTVASAMETLRKLFGPAIPDPVDWQITRWGSDPFALGSYSFHKVGSSPRSRTNLAAPVDGRLFFAGEATEEHHFATAHGAFLSGLRAAKQITG